MYKLNRFKRSFKVKSVQHLRVKNINFVLLNSVAFEGDNCNMCKEAEALLKQVARNISCQENVRAHFTTIVTSNQVCYTKSWS